MRVVAIDTETETFGPARMAPPLVVSSITETTEPELYHVSEGPAVVAEYFEQAACGEIKIVGHNFAYDAAVYCAQWPELTELVFAAYDADGVTDTMLRQMLLDIAAGCYRGWENANTGKWIKHEYGLGDLALRHTHMRLDKDSYWRTRYAELRDKPLWEWTEEAKQYALEDSFATKLVYDRQEESKPHPHILVDEFRQARAAFALHLISAWGIRTDAEGVEMLRQSAIEELDAVKPLLIKAGLLRRNGTRDLKAALALMGEVNPDGKKTETGRLSLDEESCIASGHPTLLALSQFVKAQNVLSKDVRAMELGIDQPIHSRFSSLMETGRTSSSGPNLQNLRRKRGVRECYVPREGCLFAACDFDKAELHTLAQVCKRVIGRSRLGERLVAGFDPHLDLGAQLLEISYEDAVANKRDPAVKDARQKAKPANFGFPGGLGIDGFLAYAKGQYGIDFERSMAVKLRETWHATWPEMEDYFAWIRALLGDAGVATITHLYSGRERGLVPYTVACNSFFQGLAADGAKAAMWEVIKGQYADPSSPLYGSRTVNFIHDELLIEVPEARAEACALELQRVMVEAFNPWVPDYPVTAGVALMYRWCKNAEPIYDAQGHLIPWREELAAA
jgi:DNA polymerase I-like protein with 3'-5' exonuclease and polymerase domains